MGALLSKNCEQMFKYTTVESDESDDEPQKQSKDIVIQTEDQIARAKSTSPRSNGKGITKIVFTSNNALKLLKECNFPIRSQWENLASRMGISLDQRHGLRKLAVNENCEIALEEAIDTFQRASTNLDPVTWDQLISKVQSVDKATATEMRKRLKLNVTPGNMKQLQKRCDNNILLHICGKIDPLSYVDRFALKSECDEIRQLYDSSDVDGLYVNLEMLFKWRKRKGPDATYGALLEIFKNANDGMMTDLILEYTTKGNIQRSFQSEDLKFPTVNKKENILELEQKYSEITEKFGYLIVNIIKSLETSEQPKHLTTYLSTAHSFHFEPPTNDISDIIIQISTWFNIKLLKHVVHRFGSDKDKEELLHYEQQLLAYLQQSLFNIPAESFQNGNIMSDVMICYLKIPDEDVQLLKLSGEDTLQIEKNLADYLGIRHEMFNLCQYRLGCIELVFSMPNTLYKFIQQSVVPGRFQNELRLTVDLKKILPSHLAKLYSSKFKPTKKSHTVFLTEELPMKHFCFEERVQDAFHFERDRDGIQTESCSIDIHTGVPLTYAQDIEKLDQMKCRFRHSTVVYHCEGVQKDLPVVHYNDEKRKNMPLYIGISGKRNSTGDNSEKPNKATVFSTKCPTITNSTLMTGLHTKNCLVAVMGLPSSGKSIALQRLLGSAIEVENKTVDDYMRPTTDEKGLLMYSLCIPGGEPGNKVTCSFTTNRYCAMLSTLSHIVRQADLKIQDVINVLFTIQRSFDDTLLDQHVKWLLEDTEKHLKILAEQNKKLAVLRGGITLVNVMDVGVSKAVYCLLPFILANCHKLVHLKFYSQNIDDANYELQAEKYHHESVGQFLLWMNRFIDLQMRRKQKGTIMVPTIKQQDYNAVFSPLVFEVSNSAKCTLEDQTDWDFYSHCLICVGSEESIKQGKMMLQKLVARNDTFGLPLKWIFLLTSMENTIIIPKSRIHELALNLEMTNEDVDIFLKLFTDFGSILYVPVSSILKEYVIVDVHTFCSLLDEVFYPKSSESNAQSFGIITANEAENILHSIHDDFMKIITSLGMVATINDTSRILLKDHQLKDAEVCYFVPLARTALPDTKRLDDSVQIVISNVTFPVNIQACITHTIMKCIPYASLIATEPCNVTKFNFLPENEGPPIRIALLYLDTELELQILNEFEHVLKAETTVCVCIDVVNACCNALQKKANQIQDLRFNIGLRCKKKNTHHWLHSNGESDLCDDCKRKEDNPRQRCWIQAVKNCGLVNYNKDHRLQKCKPLKPQEILDTAKELAKDRNQQNISLLASKLDIPVEESKMLQGQHSGWRLTMSLLLLWQSRSKEDNSKQELVTILKELGYDSIALKLNPPTIMY